MHMPLVITPILYSVSLLPVKLLLYQYSRDVLKCGPSVAWLFAAAAGVGAEAHVFDAVTLWSGRQCVALYFVAPASLLLTSTVTRTQRYSPILNFIPSWICDLQLV